MPERLERPRASYIVATYGRPNELEDAIDSVVRQEYRPLELVVVGKTSDEVVALFEDGRKFDEDWIEYHPHSARDGPASAKNIAFERTTGDIVVQIDDDATLPDPNATSRVVSRFRTHEDVGILAFQSRDHHTGEPNRVEIPDPPDFRTPVSEPYRTTSFVGVGCAFRREAIEAAGGLYPDDFEYGDEEDDLSIRVLDAGFDILYDPSLVVRHRKSQNARRPSSEEWERKIENRIRITVRNFPVRYVLFSTLAWSLYWLVRSKFDLRSLRRILSRLYRDRAELLDQRDVLDDVTIERIKGRSTMFLWLYGPHPRRIVRNPRRLLW